MLVGMSLVIVKFQYNNLAHTIVVVRWHFEVATSNWFDFQATDTLSRGKNMAP